MLTFDPRDAFTMEKGGVAVGGIGGVSGPPAEGEDWSTRPIEDDWTANVYQVQPQSAITDVIGHKLVCKAGDVALFDTSIWHTASPNYDKLGRARQNTIVSYRGAAAVSPSLRGLFRPTAGRLTSAFLPRRARLPATLARATAVGVWRSRRKCWSNSTRRGCSRTHARICSATPAARGRSDGGEGICPWQQQPLYRGRCR